MARKSKKPLVYKPKWFQKSVVGVILIVFIICVLVCLIDGFGIYKINNIHYFWEAFIMLMMFFSGYSLGTNAPK